ncbi:hypothetical protein COCC4DRAFT_30062 [Bipolaris maydis ATCC 48331]|uniref:NAD(P)-binding domain-containing protein n=2 Tax=Cochliobolus heterostrophus TaxID=5016 RepID=M2URS1_COCH5|nr:uncharacterized protein COCC4DRAFT_30062 [Bipolaris maydis ATCC 48331]EMD90608.1 hypothetical protein COCHEDRAFT_1022445 [Bipolaris maydis C5]KAH7555541.1 hypothetical protein BM1_07164 [Bipolaris maydis]ENI09181.1 hypothetical protein COCC4DRAFT_30062 [Bipolaris maydis ATCC 48331]KAJ5023584.1 hypothetical protein J3E73DRAFT_332061 [Bipolaris maydis]KAJ5058474.1 hypothetical protein J3E74DRAFT_360733 [Bipolaris maydis]
MLRQQMNEVDLLILGAGWTSTFLIPQLSDTDITYAATTTSGRDATIPFKFDPESGDAESYKRLPAAKTVVITFPLVGHGQSKSLVGLYRSVHGARNNWIQLGSTGIYNKVPDDWSDEDAHYNKEDKRAIAEDELRSLHGCVLCLAGLYGGERVPARWLPRIVKSKDDIKKRGAVHFIHGEDVAQAIIATHQNFTPGKRWIVSDLRVYDWYDLIMSFSSMTESSMSQEEKETQQQYAKWVSELMHEEDIRALPRDVSSLGRKLDSRRFWAYHGLLPRHRRLA